MNPIGPAEFPEEVERCYRRARRLEWITLAYVSSAVVFLYLVMGTSQAVRTSFFEDVLSLVPAVAFLVGTTIARSRSTPRFPYGKHRATSIAHLVAALGLCGMGGFLAFEAVSKGLGGHRATIGGTVVFGRVVWAGWPMLAALAYTGFPSVVLGRLKHRIAPQLHDKVLHADAAMMKADWMAETAAATGVLGSGLGLWWLDPLAALIVSLDILHDGVSNLRTAVGDLVHRRPRKADDSDWEDLPTRLRTWFQGLDWVQEARVRLREEGHVFFGDVFVVPRPGTEDLVERLAAAVDEARRMDWRLHELVVAPVPRLPREDEA